MKPEVSYRFVFQERCNMCQAPVSHHRVLGKRLSGNQGFRPAGKTGITTTVVKCHSCGLVSAQPQPQPLNLQDHYGVEPIHYWDKAYFQLDPDYFSQEIETWRKLATATTGRALDIGAGIGKGMLALTKAGFETYGLEASNTFYQYAVSEVGISADFLSNRPIEEATFPVNSFDFITFGAVLEHLADPSAAIARALPWLKPSGLIHIEVPSSRWLIQRLVNFMYRIRGLDYVSNLSPMHEPYHLFEFSLRSFQKNGVRLGYEVKHHEFYVSQAYLPTGLNGLARQIMKYTNTGMQLCVWLQKIDDAQARS